MIKQEIDIQKSEEENLQNRTGRLHKFLRMANEFLNVEFFCNFMMAIQLDILLGVFIAIKNAEFSSILRIFDFLLALAMIIGYVAFIGLILKTTYKLITIKKDSLMKVHFKTKYKKWLFIFEPLIEFNVSQSQKKNCQCIDNGLGKDKNKEKGDNS